MISNLLQTLLDLLLQVVVVTSLDDLVDTGGHRHVALFHDLPIVVLPASSLKVVLTELQWVEVELDTGVVDHVFGDRHSRGSPVGSECRVAWCVGLASLGVDSEGRELVAVVKVHHGGGYDVGRGVRVPASILVQKVVSSGDLPCAVFKLSH